MIHIHDSAKPASINIELTVLMMLSLCLSCSSISLVRRVVTEHGAVVQRKFNNYNVANYPG